MLPGQNLKPPIIIYPEVSAPLILYYNPGDFRSIIELLFVKNSPLSPLPLFWTLSCQTGSLRSRMESPGTRDTLDGTGGP